MPRRRSDSWAAGSAIVSQFQAKTGGTGAAAAAAPGGSSPQSPLPVIRQVTAEIEITITHTFTSKYVTVTIYTEHGYVLPQSRILEIECQDYQVRILFHAEFTGVVKLSP